MTGSFQDFFCRSRKCNRNLHTDLPQNIYGGRVARVIFLSPCRTLTSVARISTQRSCLLLESASDSN